MNSEGEDISVGGSSPRASNRVPRCSLCRNHGLVVDLKNHKRYCNWKNCTCVACLGTMQKRKVNANQVAARRAAKQDSELGEPAVEVPPQSLPTAIPSQSVPLLVVPPTRSPAPPLPPNHTVYSTFERVKEEISFLQTQYQSLKLDCDKLTTEKADMQRHYVTYYEMSYGLNMEMHKQTEIAKRLNTIIAQILPYLSTEQHQQQVVAAVERAKQVSMNELNGFNGLNDSSRHTLSRDAAFLPSVVHPTNFARSPSGLGVSVPSTPGGLCTSPRIGNSPGVLVAGHEGLQPLIRITPEIPMQNASMASGISINHLSDPVASSQRDHERDRKKPRDAFCSARSPVIVECRSLTALQSHKEVQAWLAQPVTNDKLGKADFEDSDGYRSDQESVVDVVNEDPGSPLVVAAIRNGIGYGDKHDEVPRHQLSLLAHSEFRQLSGERFSQERHVSVAARM